MQIPKEEVKNHIIEAAKDEFCRKGYLGSSMTRIAQDAGTAVSNIYNYFENKDKLFNAVIEPSIKEFEKGVRASLDTGHLVLTDPYKMVVTIKENLLPLLKSRRKELQILFEGCIGTKYESFIEQIKNIVYEKMLDGGNIKVNNKFSYRIFISVFMEGFKEIVKNYQDDEWLEVITSDYINFIIKGLDGLNP